MNWTEYALFGITATTAMFAVYRTFREPDENAATSIAVMEERMKGLDGMLEKVMTNHLPHIEAKLDALVLRESDHDRSVAENFSKIFTILDERFPRKQ